MNISIPFLGGGNPQEIGCRPLVRIAKPECRKIGDHSIHYAAIAGGAVGNFSLPSFFLPHCGLRLLVSGTTRKMGREDNRDAIYAASITGPEFNAMFIVMADGVGSQIGSGLAASAFIQGAHLAVARSITESRFRGPANIFFEAAVAFRYQKSTHSCAKASTTGLVMVISTAGIQGAYAGDTIPTLHTRDQGCSSVEPHSRPDSRNILTSSVADGTSTSFTLDLQAGSILYSMTDGAQALMDGVSEEIRLPSKSTRDRRTADALLGRWIAESEKRDGRDNSSLILVRVDSSAGLRGSSWK